MFAELKEAENFNCVFIFYCTLSHTQERLYKVLSLFYQHIHCRYRHNFRAKSNGLGKYWRCASSSLPRDRSLQRLRKQGTDTDKDTKNSFDTWSGEIQYRSDAMIFHPISWWTWWIVNASKFLCLCPFPCSKHSHYISMDTLHTTVSAVLNHCYSTIHSNFHVRRRPSCG